MYGIGFEHNPGEFGMTHGPTPSLQRLLEEVGDRGSRIIRFRRDGYDEVIYRWRKDRWVRYHESREEVDQVKRRKESRRRPTNPPKRL